MKRSVVTGFLVIAAHWAVAIWHLFLVAKVVPAPDNDVSWVAIGVLSVVHACIALVWWKVSIKIAGSVLALFFIAALSFDIYEHFLHAGPNNIFGVANSQWNIPFQISVILLVVLEVVGCLVGIRCLATRKIAKTGMDLSC
jgi:hypothetical protein